MSKMMVAVRSASSLKLLAEKRAGILQGGMNVSVRRSGQGNKPFYLSPLPSLLINNLPLSRNNHLPHQNFSPLAPASVYALFTI